MHNFVVYKSSAGSGKTYTLVKEYLKLALADPHRLNRTFKNILAVTFTNKAAAEMKERIVRALAQISGGEKVPLATDLQAELKISEDDLRARCEELHSHLLHQYADFSVCTIDSFVYRIVRRFSIDLQLPANFSVETDEETALWWAIDTLLTDVQNKVVQQFLLEYASEKVDEQKNWKIESEIFSLAKSVLISKKDAETGLLGERQIDGLVEVKRMLRKKTAEIEEKLTGIADQAFSLLKQKNISPDDFRYGKNGVFGYFRKLRDKEFDEQELLKKYVLDAVYEDKWYTSKNPVPEIDAITSEIKRLFKEAEAYREKNSADYYLYLLLQKNINALCVLSELNILVNKYKSEKNIVFISEFNKTVADFIRAEPVPFIYERLGDRYKNYLVDEFQDTSGLQWLNLLPLVHNSLSEGKFCMLVGDGKQSIYRWRGADVRQFVNLPEVEGAGNSEWIAEQARALQDNYEEKQLNVNRRSRDEVITFNNKLFNFLSQMVLEEPYKKVYEDSTQQTTGKKGGKIVVSFVQENNEEAEAKVLEQTLAAIQQSIAKKYNYSDIAVLVRKNTFGNLLANHLLQNKIPVVSSDSLLLKNCPEVNFIISFMSWLINERNTIAAGAILAYLQETGKLKTENFTLSQEAVMPDGIKAAFKENDFAVFSPRLRALPLYELCSEVIRLFDISARNPLYISFFLDEVTNFSQKENNSVFSFLQWWIMKGENLSVKIPQNTNAVRVLTIHASKGLEFPVVIFPFADWKVQSPESILVDTHEEIPGLPVALVKTENALKKTKFREQAIDEEQKQQLDNLNLLYVACTRAEEELHIIAREHVNRGASAAAWLRNFVSHEYAEQAQGNLIEIGEEVAKPHPTVKEIPHLKPVSFRPLHEAVTIKLSDSDAEEQGRRAYGIAVHALLAEIETKTSGDSVLEKALMQGNINQDQRKELEKALEAVFADPLIAPYFSGQFQIKSEAELFVQGEIIRPDRVIICPDHIAVLDFKTGEKKKEHATQLNRYKSALQMLYKKPVRSFLVYFSAEVIEII
jgi:ATP-dependent exoDNAse (exonuclease V) beta subunit